MPWSHVKRPSLHARKSISPPRATQRRHREKRRRDLRPGRNDIIPIRAMKAAGNKDMRMRITIPQDYPRQRARANGMWGRDLAL